MLTLIYEEQSSSGRIEDTIGDLTGRSLIVLGIADRYRVVPLNAARENELKRVLKRWIFPVQLEGHLCGDTAYRLEKILTAHSRPRESSSASPTERRSLKCASGDQYLDFYKLSPGNYPSFIYAFQRFLELIAIFEMFKQRFFLYATGADSSSHCHAENGRAYRRQQRYHQHS